MVEFKKDDEGKKAFLIFKEREESDAQELFGIIEEVSSDKRTLRFKLFSGRVYSLEFDLVKIANIKDKPGGESGGI
jgi:hypothetical protein